MDTMAPTERVVVTLPAELVRGIDSLARNRSRFIADAVEHEIVRRRRESLLESLQNPHPETSALAASGLGDWETRFSAVDHDLVDTAGGTAVRWEEGHGWVESGQ